LVFLRHWYFRKVLKITKNPSGLFFRKNADKEKKNARRRKYPFSSLITPSVGTSFHLAKHLPSRDVAVLAPRHPQHEGCPCPLPALAPRLATR